MKTLQWLAVSGLALVISFAHLASAQMGMVISSSSEFSDPADLGSPYTAEYKTTTVRKLANGATITQTEKSLIARDSQGRTHTEQALGPYPSQENKWVTVFDPVSRTVLSWQTFNKEVQITHLPSREEMRAQAEKIRDLEKSAKEKQSPGGSSSSKSVTAAGSSSSVMTGQEEADTEEVPGKEESMGNKSINGIVAAGTRTTSTIPKGAIGNDLPLVSTHEIWISTELKLSVLEIDDDPNNGTTTRELVKLDRSEPDPALFRIPEGYTVKENGAFKGIMDSEVEPRK